MPGVFYLEMSTQTELRLWIFHVSLGDKYNTFTQPASISACICLVFVFEIFILRKAWESHSINGFLMTILKDLAPTYMCSKICKHLSKYREFNLCVECAKL